MIQVNNLSKNNGTTVLKNRYSLEIKRRSFGLVGNNGAGKTTFQPFTGSNSAVNGNIVNNGVQVNTSEAWKPSPHRS
jgi:ABC-2 type transport system ATP-binding protein